MSNYSKWFPMKIKGSIVYLRHILDGDGKWEVQPGNLGDVIQVHDFMPADMNLEEVVSNLIIKDSINVRTKPYSANNYGKH